MRKALVFIFFLFFGFLYIGSAEAAIIVQAPKYVGLNSGLVLNWSFDAKDINGTTVLDRSGQGNNGTLTNGPMVVQGKIGQAMNFDGSDDHIIRNAGAVSGVPLTISTWVKFENGPDPDNAVVLVGLSDSDSASWEAHYLSINEAANTVHAVSADDTTFTDASGPATPNQWHHVVGVWASDTDRSIYVDGVFKSRDTTSKSPSAMDTTMVGGFSAAQGSPDNFSKAAVDDIRIYNRALTAAEIQRLYKIGNTFKIATTISNDTLAKGLVGHWTMDGKDINGTSMTDRSGNGNTGTLTNGPTPAIGKIGQALSFDGGDDVISLGSPASLDNLSTMTISLWFKASRVGDPDQFDISQIVNKEWGLTIDGGSGNYIKFRANNSASGAYIQRATPTNSITTNTWYFVVVKYTRGTCNLEIFINGVSQSLSDLTSCPSGDPADDSSVTAALGDLIACCSQPQSFKGLLDDVRIYNRLLTRAEIQRLYKIGGTFKINTSSTVNPSDPLTRGLVGYWSFDGKDMGTTSANDISGNGNIGWFNNAAGLNYPQKVIGKIGQALQFDGTDDEVRLGANSSAFNFSGPVSGSAWIKTNKDGAFIVLYQSSNPLWYMQIGDTTAGGTANKFVVYTRTNVGNIEVFSGNKTITDDNWHHVAFVRDTVNARLRMYVDGIEDANHAILDTGAIDTSGNTLHRISLSSQNQFRGIIDDVRVYNRVLSFEEIKRLYQMGR